MNAGRKNDRIRIPLDKAKDFYDHKDVTVLDVVDSEDYDDFDYQIEGAERINPEDIKEKYTQLPEDRRVLAY